MHLLSLSLLSSSRRFYLFFCILRHGRATATVLYWYYYSTRCKYFATPVQFRISHHTCFANWNAFVFFFIVSTSAIYSLSRRLQISTRMYLFYSSLFLQKVHRYSITASVMHLTFFSMHPLFQIDLQHLFEQLFL